MWLSTVQDNSAAPETRTGPLVASLDPGDERPRDERIDGSNMARAVGNIVMASAVSADDSPSAAAEPESDGQPRSLILGKWEDEYHGKRHLTVNEDGTGKMLVEPDGIGKALFAAELKFDIEWEVHDGKVTLKMVRGEPKSKVQLILKLYGSEAEYKIVELTRERMLLLDGDGKTQYDWRRPGAAPDAPE